MSQFKSDFLNVLSERGFIHQISDPEYPCSWSFPIS